MSEAYSAATKIYKRLVIMSKKVPYQFFACLLVACLVFAGCGSASALDRASEGASNYTISAVLDFENKTLSASDRVEYKNNSANDLNEIKFHLYPNAFRSEATVFKAVSDTQFSRAYPNGFSEGSITINAVSVAGKDADFEIAGDDKNLLSVPLSTPLRAGQSIEIEIYFEIVIPNCNHRFGYGENTLNLGNWYPIACVFENGEFVTDGYSPNGDPFYSDVANYVVELTYPSYLTLSSTGEVVDSTPTAAPQTNSENLANNETKFTKTTMTARAVRDFAMILSEKFETKTATVGETTINYFYYDDENSDAHLQTAVDALNTFNEMFGEYPYSTLNVAKANFLQGGMEYPNLVFISDEVDVDSEYNNVIIHEIAHQWWYGVIGNNECENAWLDEGLADYSTALFYDQNPSYNRTSDEIFGSALSSYLLFCDVYREVYDDFDTSMNRNIHKFNTETEYVYLTYVKGVLMFDSLSEMVGQDKMFKVLKNFYSENAFTNASPADLVAAFEDVTHKKLAGYIMSWLDGSVVFEELS